MIINNHNGINHVKFISYTGKYPNLCSGILTLEIDGKEYKFGNSIQYQYSAVELFCFVQQFFSESGGSQVRVFLQKAGGTGGDDGGGIGRAFALPFVAA